ncbi:MAG: hypothetical protein Q8R53_03340 [Nanoarchaeota archaeon]|nr:hypothetical protein [Nanoarchaeota archaeon]
MEEKPTLGEFRKGLAFGTFGTALLMMLAYEYGGIRRDGKLETLLRIRQTPYEVREQYDADGNLVLPRRVFENNQSENR